MHWSEDILNNSILDEIVKIENLHWAWEKAKSFYHKHEHWYDQFEIASFSANYDYELKSIIEDIRDNSYTLKPLRPIFFPKGTDDQGKPRNRQMFWVSVRDQVTWLAVMNVIGQYYDRQMPFWSYGNRLYVSMFPIAEKDDRIRWGFGPYRNTTTNTYRSFQQSWPRFRKDIYLTAKLMTSQKGQLNKDELEDIKDNENLNKVLKVKYKEPGYWKRQQKDLYWCSIDLRKFYPSAKVEVIKRNFKEFGKNVDDFQKIENLLASLLKFEISYDGLDDITEEDYISIGLDGKRLEFDGIPTGLFTAGFLANVAMLKVDDEAHKLLVPDGELEKHIAQFRFVDDHTFLATNSEKLFEWIETYKNLLETHFVDNKGNACIEISWEKTKPDEYGKYLEKKFHPDEKFQQLGIEQQAQKLDELKNAAVKSMYLDPHYPSTLMNMTLEKMSMINNTPFDLLDEEEGKKVLTDLEHLLVADFPDEEIRKDTRISYASSRLALLTSRVEHDFSKIYFAKKEMLLVEKEKKDLECLKAEKADNKAIDKKLDEAIVVFYSTQKRYDDAKKELENEIFFDRQRVFKLLQFAIHKYPDKLKLWKNAVLFCEKNGFAELVMDSTNYSNELKEIWDSIQKFEKSNAINKHTKIYLMTFFYDLVIHSLIRVYKILNTPNLTYREINRKCSYLNQLLNQKFLQSLFDEEKECDIYYLKQSRDYLKVVIGTVVDLLVELPASITEKLDLGLLKTPQISWDLLDWTDKPFTYLQKAFNDPDAVVWSMVEQISSHTSKQPLSFLSIYFEASELLSPCAQALAAMYPEFVSREKVLKLAITPQSQFLPFSWWYELAGSEKFPKRTENLQNEALLECLEYLDGLEGRQSMLKLCSNDSFLLKNREIQVLGVVGQILDRWCSIPLKSLLTGEQEDLMTAFPYNLFINEDHTVEFQNIRGIVINDKRYFPDFVDSLSNGDEEKMIFAIGILFFQLITGNKELPRSMYFPGTQLFNLGYFLHELEKYPISSYTFEIIESCISKRKRETRKLKMIPINELFQDDSEDEWIIYTIRDLLNAVTHVKSLLEKKKYVFDKNDRYLIPISLNKIKEESMTQGSRL